MSPGFRARSEQSTYFFGVGFSLIVHVISAFFVIIVLERNAAQAYRAPEVFSVTLEGGEVLGGISQVPDGKKNKKAKPADASQSEPEPKRAEPEVPKEAEVKKEPESKEPQVVEVPKEEPKPSADDLKKIELKQIEDQKKAEALKKVEEAKKEEERKKATEDKKKQEEAKKKEEEAKKVAVKAAEDKKLAQKNPSTDINKRLNNAIANMNKRYTGESANAGGEGFGAASLGGKGMGGGTLKSMEFIAYSNALESHIKEGWRWLPGARVLRAQVLVRILQDGTVQNAKIESSSGSSHFDDSVIRAVYKASPVPQAPPQIYEQFQEVLITFDSHNQ